MARESISDLDRRGFVTRLLPACPLAWLALGNVEALARPGQDQPAAGTTHKFDIESSTTTTTRQQVTQQNRALIQLVKTLQGEMNEAELLRLLRLYSAEVGRQVGVRQAQRSPDTTFATFVATFRPPAYADTLTHEVVEDSATSFKLKVTECVWASVYRDAGLGGEIGHAAVCNMDYHWPEAFNPRFRMERTKTLMQGHECCNHHYFALS